MFACKLSLSLSHTHTPFLAFSPLINSVAGVCVCVCSVCVCVTPRKWIGPCLSPRALLTDRWTMAGCKEPHHAGIETYDEISNYGAGECVCVGASHTHTHTHARAQTHTRTAAHLIELLPYSAKSLPLSHYDLAAATSQHY